MGQEGTGRQGWPLNQSLQSPSYMSNFGLVSSDGLFSWSNLLFVGIEVELAKQAHREEGKG